MNTNPDTDGQLYLTIPYTSQGFQSNYFGLDAMNNPRNSITAASRYEQFHSTILGPCSCAVFWQHMPFHARKAYMYSFFQIYEECKLLLLVLTGERPCVIRSNYNHCCVKREQLEQKSPPLPSPPTPPIPGSIMRSVLYCIKWASFFFI